MVSGEARRRLNANMAGTGDEKESGANEASKDLLIDGGTNKKLNIPTHEASPFQSPSKKKR